jgi:uncharacterized membrane protein
MAAFLAVDLLWLGIVARDLYRTQLGHLLAPDVRWGPALLFYMIFVLGILVFAVLPGLESGSLFRSILLGGFLGLVGYAAFDLTSLALIKDFPGGIVPIDMVWGCCLSAFTAAAGFGVGRWLGLG